MQNFNQFRHKMQRFCIKADNMIMMVVGMMVDDNDGGSDGDGSGY